MKLSDLGPVEAPDMSYLEEQRKKFGWKGLMPSNLSDQALMSLAKDMRYPQIRGQKSWVPEMDWINAAASFATESIVFEKDANGTSTMRVFTADGIGMAQGHFQYLVEYEIISRITGRSLMNSLDADAESMREFAKGE